MRKTGYHYTSKKNWNSIRRHGLVPYQMDGHIKSAVGMQDLAGVWLWINNPKGRSHFGNVLYHMAKKNVEEVVKLRVTYDFEDTLTPHPETGKKRLLLSHRGAVENYVYHENEAAAIVLRTIPPSDIKVVGEYNLRRLFTQHAD